MLVIVFIILFINTVIADVNVALNKTVTYCGGKRKYASVTDGNRALTNAVSINVLCGIDAYIEIDLKKKYYIDYVILYEGKFKMLDYFKVYVDSNFCGHYPKKSIRTILNKGMRLNCLLSTSSRMVKVQSLFDIGFSIAEAEVYTIFSDYERRAVLIHIGCFKSFEGTETAVVDQRDCIEMCQNYTEPFAFFKDSSSCHCGKINKRDKLPLANCHIKCGDKYCGGDDAYSVYLARIELPHFMSCYSGMIRGNRSVGTSINDCFMKCPRDQYIALQKGEVCLCLPDLSNLHRVNNSLCDMPCNKTDELCGGENHYSIYKFLLRGQNIEILFHCKTKMDQYGLCKNGCDRYYIGDYCFENIIQYCHNFNPCMKMPNMKCVTTAAVNYQCECMDGFIKNSNESCNDVDECVYIPCNELFSTCANLPGSYECTCKPGVYPNLMDIVCVLPQNASIPVKPIENTTTSLSVVAISSTTSFESSIADTDGINTNPCESFDPCAKKLNSECIIFNSTKYRCECMEGYTEISGFCKDVDECVYEPCDEISSTCFNIQGAYRCDCLDFFVQVTEFVCISNKTYSFDLSENIAVISLFIIPLLVIFIALIIVMLFSKEANTISLSSTSSAAN